MRKIVIETSTSVCRACIAGVIFAFVLLFTYPKEKFLIIAPNGNVSDAVVISANSEQWEHESELDKIDLLNTKINLFRFIDKGLFLQSSAPLFIRSTSSTPFRFSNLNGSTLMMNSSRDFPSFGVPILNYFVRESHKWKNSFRTGMTNELISRNQKFIQGMNHAGPPKLELI